MLSKGIKIYSNVDQKKKKTNIFLNVIRDHKFIVINKNLKFLIKIVI